MFLWAVLTLPVGSLCSGVGWGTDRRFFFRNLLVEASF